MKSKKLLLGVLCLAALILYACTGGSEPALVPSYNSFLNGSYQIHQVSDASAVAVTDTLRADVTADGAGAGTMNIAAGNHSAGATGSGTTSYTVAADRTFSITTSAGTVVNGIVSATGSPFVLTDTNRTVSATEDAGVVMAAGIRKSSGLTPAFLSGNYQIHQAGDAGAGLYTSRVNIIANGFGNGTWTIVGHSAGGTGNTGSFTYTVSAIDGTLSVTTKDLAGTTTTGTDYGIMSADGSMFLITDTNSTASAGPPVEDAEIIMAIGMKKSTSTLTNAVLNGNYQIHQVGKGAAGRYTARVNITADGAGNGMWTIASHSVAGEAGKSGVFTYMVAADGTFSVTTKDATGTITIGTDYGIVSADGSMFAITDTNLTYSAGIEDAEIIMAIGMKK